MITKSLLHQFCFRLSNVYINVCVCVCYVCVCVRERERFVCVFLCIMLSWIVKYSFILYSNVHVCVWFAIHVKWSIKSVYHPSNLQMPFMLYRNWLHLPSTFLSECVQQCVHWFALWWFWQKCGCRDTGPLDKEPPVVLMQNIHVC